MRSKIIYIVMFSMCTAVSSLGADDHAEVQKTFLSANSPIEFYGRVIDQNSDPVEEAEVTLLVSGYGSPILGPGITIDNKRKVIKTDKSGNIELHHEKGTSVSLLKIEKKGYVFIDDDIQRDYHYSPGAQKKHQPNKANPVIFTMRKKEPPILVCTHGLHFELNQNNKYEQAIDVVRGNWGALGQVGKAAYYGDEHEDVSIQAVLSEDKNSFAVSFTSTDKDGGILEREELLYVVPESGYESVHTIQMPVNSNLKKYLYFKGRQGDVFAKIDLELQSGTNGVGVHMTTWTNPKGGRSVDYYPEIEAEEDRRIYNEKKQKAIEREERKKLKQQK